MCQDIPVSSISALVNCQKRTRAERGGNSPTLLGGEKHLTLFISNPYTIDHVMNFRGNFFPLQECILVFFFLLFHLYEFFFYKVYKVQQLHGHLTYLSLIVYVLQCNNPIK